MEAGQTIAGKYRLNRLLGTGGMAFVWAATNVFTEREFAIKFMLPQVARTPDAAQRFLLEAKVSARIDHPNIIEVIDVGQADDGTLFLVMEILNGVSLDVALRQPERRMTGYELLVVMRDVASALAAAHRNGVVHRDLKPTNIFLHADRDGRVAAKVLDFGVSKIVADEVSTGLTVAGAVIGSPLYMSPEQAKGATDVDGRSDIFAFGTMLFEAFTGQRPYDAPNFNALILMIATKKAKSIDEIAPHLSEAVRALVRDCLAYDKEARLATFDVVVERLSALLPDLEHAELRLPSWQGATPAVGAEAVDARSASSRRGASSSRMQQGAQGRSPAPVAHAFTPAAQVAPLAMQVTNPPPRSDGRGMPAIGLPNGVWLRMHVLSPHGLARLAASSKVIVGGLVAVAVLIGLASAFMRGGPSYGAGQGGPNTAAGESSWSGRPPAFPLRDGDASMVPLVPVDSLPAVTRAAPPTKTPSNTRGRLQIAASPGWCSVSIDGIARGVTPMAGVDLTPGTHWVECVPPSGKPHATSVSVSEGKVTRYKFGLEQ